MSRGQIFQTNSGWGFALKYTDGAEAKRIKRQGYGTKAMAEKALREALTTLDSGRAVSSARLTLEKYLLGFEGVGGWLEKYERRQKVKATTLSAVTNHVNAYIVPRLGKVSLGALDTDTLESFYLDLLEGGKKNGEPLNPKTVRNIAGTLHKALEDAVRSRKIPNNPSSHAELPRWEKPDLVIWEESNLLAFLEYAEVESNIRDAEEFEDYSRQVRQYQDHIPQEFQARAEEQVLERRIYDCMDFES